MLPDTCRFKDVFGAPGRGVHAARVPFTRTAAVDYGGTLLLAWGTSAVSGLRLSVTTIAWFAAAEFLHWLFCVRIGAGHSSI